MGFSMTTSMNMMILASLLWQLLAGNFTTMSWKEKKHRKNGALVL
jgi:hypothetical protein